MLQHADIPGPYFVVGHSSGGLTVRVFADAYPAEVVGVVLIESMSPSRATQAAHPHRQSRPHQRAGCRSLRSRRGWVWKDAPSRWT